ncbi:DUF4249 domain-containing protein [Oceanihabitans sp. 2_MG-2023]|uniref:DUF4249 domain-containing protein n=1 Tax=Oceanihabitans sp. 2_MG-2023 TaxID=3062661 RepID=UPI0026E2F419|nr:DUF4249 domain-containing protein [Oceanihabitans sp. 2_MG-2023]MDO6597144.1 DUF4249 domain-containing protein [Oceanihabitans sp. 2_MG-2023]
MKQVIILILLCVFTFSCEDVIDINVPTESPKLVIDASINWLKDTPGNEQSIKLTLSADFYEDLIPPANNAQVSITDLNNNTFDFVEDGQTGIYQNNTFIPEINGVYNLTIIYNDEVYNATETLKSVSEIDFVEQELNGGFTGEETEIKVYFTDPAEQENYYFFEYVSSIEDSPVLDTLTDEFINGNQIFGLYIEEDLEPGDTITAKHFGVSERFYEFMFLLLQQTSDDGGGPFETQPATVRGNCINLTNPENFPFGYFRLSEVAEIQYTIQ